MYRSTRTVFWQDLADLQRPLAIAFANLSYISASLILATLSVFIMLPIFILKELKIRLNAIHYNNTNLPVQLSMELEKWRKFHDLIICLVDNINYCFGPCLLIYMIFATGVFVGYSSHIVIEYQFGTLNNVIGSYILQIFTVLVRFFVILYQTQILKNEVIMRIFFLKISYGFE